ncbi:hypothetical protein ACIBTV_22365 [Micromonospora sp. NPDC049366]|uniref:hypothetical protein n=1 Tax=Micromonospora sp. NPDC049366 TaxID=3364271 RepID=UPI0037A305A7
MGGSGRLTGPALALVGSAVAGAVVRALVVPRRPDHAAQRRDPNRWQVVTVGRPPGEVLPDGRWPEPLRRLGDAVEVRVHPAPGGRGTELAARSRPGVAPPGLAAHLVGDDPGRLVGRALRQAKQLVETGEVLRADRSAVDRTGTAD